MERVFTKTVGHFGAGEIRDYPNTVWESIARSAKMPLDSFSKPTDVAVKETFLKKK